METFSSYNRRGSVASPVPTGQPRRAVLGFPGEGGLVASRGPRGLPPWEGWALSRPAAATPPGDRGRREVPEKRSVGRGARARTPAPPAEGSSGRWEDTGCWAAGDTHVQQPVLGACVRDVEAAGGSRHHRARSLPGVTGRRLTRRHVTRAVEYNMQIRCFTGNDGDSENGPERSLNGWEAEQL